MAIKKIISLTSSLHSTSLSDKRVFLRADLNIPIDQGTITDDYRLQALLPTINIIQQKGGKVILATHIGRPTQPDGSLSTQHLLPWFKAHGYAIVYEADLATALIKSHDDFNTILLLENMRFFAGEKNGDSQFAHQLAHLGDYYVNDAFALLHREDTSITLVPELFTPDHRSIGLLIEKELLMLNTLLINPVKPFVLILGGGKVADKLPLLYSLANMVDVVLLGPAIVFSFLKAQNKPVGASLVDTHYLDACNQFIVDADKKNIKLVFPIDYQIARDTFNGPLSYTDEDRFPADGVGISIGLKTADLFAREIKNAGTLFFNGLMGSIHRPETLAGAHAIFKAMALSPGKSIVGGGDSVAAAQFFKMGDSLDFLSTGGGVTLSYLSGNDLPGLRSFIPKK